MKYRVLGLVMTAVMVLAMAAFSFYSPENGERRIHQHLTSRGPNQGCDCDGSQLCTHLPLVILDTGGVDVPGEPLSSDGTLLKPEDHEYEYTRVTLAEDGSKTIACQVSVVDHTDSNNHPGDEPTLQSAAQIRIRGNTSRLHDKKGYLLSLTTDDEESNRDAQMLGMDPHHEWALHGPYLDKTLIRNYLWYNIAGEIMDYAPNVRFCEVILNGEYLGLYLMTETITNGEDSRLKMTMPQDGSDAVSYVVRLDRGSSTPMKNIETFTQYALRTYNVLDIAYPGAGNLTPERIEYIRQDFSDFEKVLYSYDYNTEPYAWWNLADMDSFADYFLLHEFTCNYDVGSRSTYMYKDLRGTYKMCIWDFNSACDNFYESQLKPQRFQLQNITWFYMILKDENFVNHTIERYRELRTSYLSEEYLNTYIDETIAYLGPAIDRNFSVWGYTFEDYRPLTPDSRNPDDYLEAVDQLKDFCRDRGYWMDENIDKLLQFCHPSKNKKFNH